MNGVEDRTGHPSGDELLAWHDGELDVVRGTRIRDHLADCAACRRELQDLRDDLAWTSRKLASLDIEPDSLRRPALPRRGSPRRTAWRPLAAAVVLVLMIGGGVVALVPGGLLRGWLDDAPDDAPVAGDVAPEAVWTERLATTAPEVLTILIEGADSTEIEIVRTRDDAVVVLTRAGFPLGRVELGGDGLVLDPGRASRIRLRIPMANSARVLHGNETLLELPRVQHPDSSTVLVVGRMDRGGPR